MVALPFCHVTLRGQRPLPGRGNAADPRTLGVWLWKRRTDLGLIQRQVAAALRVHFETIGKWERDRQRPKAAHMATLCRVLGKPPGDIIERWRSHPPRENPHRGRPLSTPPVELRTIGDHLRKRRLDLGLVQSEVAAQLGVTTFTVTNWEINRTVPAVRCHPGLIRFLGYVPFAVGETLPERLRAGRLIRGLSQRAWPDY